ncbi:uncharacterized protein PpBr36_11205 [Pyricularia pennisetigena]|uniref:uncharacterized protein n=1 Tax=Pyricularia pennisetigena TaxID=1578925 RepID=UPI00114F343E|nr:uncharacterized protein PpBr36_11205 [Pyricularia pennisetigena]TLS20387.1 hypothetical protein PpBr36_11205 [Pyricularia pennisetigena]
MFDLAFSKDGDYLYMSGTTCDCIVLIYKILLDGNRLEGINHVATPKYKLTDRDGSEFDSVRLLPQRSSQGCFIGTSRLNSLLLWQAVKSNDGNLYILKTETYGKVIAAATQGSRILLLIKRKGLYQYDIERGTSGPRLCNQSYLGNPKFKREPAENAIVRIFSLGNCVWVSVFYAKGEAEAFEFLPLDRPSLDPR